MPTDDDEHSKTKDGPSQPAPAARTLHNLQSILAIPAPIKRLFDHFPLLSYPANSPPAGAYDQRTQNVLFVATTPADAAAGAPSFHPGCLKWQTLLKIYEIPFAIRPSTNHASPTSTLPFLIPAASANAISVSNLASWIRAGSDAPARAPSSALHEALLRPVRAAYLHALFVARPSIARRLYVDGATRAGVVRDALAWQMACTAEDEVVGASGALWPRVDATTVYGEAEDALEALAVLLGGGTWFGRTKEGNVEGVDGVYDEKELPGMLDAAVFGYTHVILHVLDGEEGGAQEPEALDARRLVQAVRDHGNLVEHRERMLRHYYD